MFTQYTHVYATTFTLFATNATSRKPHHIYSTFHHNRERKNVYVRTDTDIQAVLVWSGGVAPA